MDAERVDLYAEDSSTSGSQARRFPTGRPSRRTGAIDGDENALERTLAQSLA
jgi:hypothetical protein